MSDPEIALSADPHTGVVYATSKTHPTPTAVGRIDPETWEATDE